MSPPKLDESIFDKLAEILKKHNLAEIEYKYGEMKIRLSKGSIFPAQTLPSEQILTPPSRTLSEPPPSEISNFSEHPGAFKSPMVGTCYLAPEAGAKNFVAIGDIVQAGQPILIIEAMKVMNLIKAHKSGKIVHVAISNSEPVEFGQLLVVIE
ncbi:MAG: acetyl-CoA carboxylase, biotin carboxyl carrier protein [Holosporales bacterium]|jgi:acetyl-CoA carboxylase biotin carboxyl carrier protein|nr:acetyl-CoA carboxylase, biotin carboxyl carrier protein [Holosporales bacterium]